MSKISLSVPPIKGYNIVDKLGSGTYATVYKAHKSVQSLNCYGQNPTISITLKENWFPKYVLCIFQSKSRDVVAVKCVLKSSLNKASTENLLTEIELLKTLRHPHIVSLCDFSVSF